MMSSSVGAAICACARAAAAFLGGGREELHRLRVVTLGGEPRELDARGAETLGHVKARLAAAAGLHASQHRLFLGGSELGDEASVADCLAAAPARGPVSISLVLSAPRQLEVVVGGSTKGLLFLSVPETEPIRLLKDRIHAVAPLRWDQHVLWLAGSPVDDDRALLDYAAADGAALQIAPAPPAWWPYFQAVVALLGWCGCLAMLFHGLAA